jgi:parvulin-like peptidyl-prolyl isomerase
MTFRARPAVRRPGRAGWDPGDRRNALINAGFVGAIIVSILLLVGYGGWSWYQSHYGAAATVDGTVITRDDLNTRLKIENFRLDYISSSIQTMLTEGHISQSDAASELSYIQQQQASLTSLTLERLVDVALMTELANQEGIQVTDADVDAQLTSEATTSEQRHVWMIEIRPDTDPATGQPTDAQKAAAKQKADAALAALKSGTSWDDVAKQYSDSATAPQSGDLGWLTQDSGYDQPFLDAVFAAQQDSPTDVILGADGDYRIGRATEISPSSVDSTYQDRITQYGISMADYRTAVRGDVIRKKLSDKVVADLSQPGPQRHVLEIYLPEPNTSVPLGPAAVKIRDILFAPNDDPTTAADLPADDPAWAKAKADAEAAYAELVKNPESFDQMARTLSDDPATKANGGKEPWYDSTSTGVDPTLLGVILDVNLQPGQLLRPVKTAEGWRVIQFMRTYGDGDASWLQSLKGEAESGADFATLARDNSEGAEAKAGGDIGWIAKSQLSSDLEDAIFATAPGSVSDPVTVSGDGTYLFKVLAEETRTPTKDQLTAIKANGFSDWYTQKKAAANITEDYALTGVSG